ncbi:MAG: hypothetical protein Q8R32_03210, partial [bacterium]|nr:hypothetical protein [bacterium]
MIRLIMLRTRLLENSTRRFRAWLQRSSSRTPAVAALIAFLVLALFGTYWLRGQLLLFFDILFIAAPFEDIFARSQRMGEIPTWIPEMQSGYPILGAPHMNFFYPLHAVLRQFLPGVLVINLSLALHVFLAGLGMWLFLRRERLPCRGAITGALLYALGVHMTGRFGLVNIIFPLAWIPFILWSLHRLWHQPSAARVAAVALFAALHALAGSPQMTIIGAGLIAAYVASLILTTKHRAGERSRRLGIVGLALLSTVGLLGVQLVPVLANLQATDRESPLTRSELLEFGYPPWQPLTWVFPDAYGHLQDYFGAKNEPELAFSFGVAGSLAVASGLALLRHAPRRLALFSALLLVYGIALAPGEHSPIYRWLVDQGAISRFAQPARFLAALHFGGAVLAAHAIAVLPTFSIRRRSAIVLISLLLAAGVLVLVVRTLPDVIAERTWSAIAHSPWRFLSPTALILTLSVVLWPGPWRPRRTAITICIMATELLIVGWWYNPSEPAPAVLQRPWVLQYLGGVAPQPRLYTKMELAVTPPPDYNPILWRRPPGLRRIRQTFKAQQDGLDSVSLLLTWGGK